MLLQNQICPSPAGDGEDYLSLSLRNGWLQLSVNLGSGRLDTGTRDDDVDLADGRWHHVVVTRVAKEVSWVVCVKPQLIRIT